MEQSEIEQSFGFRLGTALKELTRVVKGWDHRCVSWARGKKLPAWIGHIPLSVASVAVLTELAGILAGYSLPILVLLVFLIYFRIKYDV